MNVPLPGANEEARQRYRKEVIRRRRITQEVDGKEFRLITNLLDPEAYPAELLARCCHERWEVEVINGEVKVTVVGSKGASCRQLSGADVLRGSTRRSTPSASPTTWSGA